MMQQHVYATHHTLPAATGHATHIVNNLQRWTAGSSQKLPGLARQCYSACRLQHAHLLAAGDGFQQHGLQHAGPLRALRQGQQQLALQGPQALPAGPESSSTW
jgi:hypothetical protein